MKLAVSILKSNYDEKESIKRINETTADYLHVDVMDGKFVIEKTPKYKYLYESTKPLQVHLMVSSPFKYIEEYSLMNTESITIPSELDDDINGLLNLIKSKGLKCGLALNPETDVNKVLPYLSKIDNVIVMTVVPGKGGQKLIESVLYKIDVLKKYVDELKHHIDIIVDGGVNDETIELVKNVDVAVCGSFICMSEDFQEQINKLNL